MKTRYFLFEPEVIPFYKVALRKCCNGEWFWYSCDEHRWEQHYAYINIPDGKELTEEEAFRYILEH